MSPDQHILIEIHTPCPQRYLTPGPESRQRLLAGRPDAALYLQQGWKDMLVSESSNLRPTGPFGEALTSLEPHLRNRGHGTCHTEVVSQLDDV